MLYQKNTELEYIQADDNSLAAFDPESGDVHLLDGKIIDMLNILTVPHDLNGLLDKLCGIYDTTPQRIKPDVEAFLNEAAEKKVVIAS